MAAGLRTRFGAERSPGLLLWQVTNSWQAQMRRVLAPFGLTHVQFVLLTTLAWLSGQEPAGGRGTTQRALADMARSDPMMVSQVLRVLEGRGLVARPVDPHDARARRVTVTAEGADLVDRANSAVEDADQAFFAALGADQEGFTDALGALAGHHRPPSRHPGGAQQP